MNRRKQIAKGFSPLIFMLVVSGFIPVFSQSSGELEVKVNDHYTGDPVDSARVSILLDDKVVDTGFTDSEGKTWLVLRTTDSPDDQESIPSSFEISENYPNPFRDETRIDVSIPEEQTMTAEVYNVIGQRVLSQSMTLTPGQYRVDLSLAHMSTGIYLVRLRGNEQKTVSITKSGSGLTHQSPAGAPSGSLRFSGGGRTPVKPADTGNGASVTGGSSGAGSPGVRTTDEHGYELLVSKDGFEEWSEVKSLSEETSVEVPLVRRNRVEIRTVAENLDEVKVGLSVSGGEVAEEITTPGELILPSGVYHVTGQSDSLFYSETFEIASRDTVIVMEPAGPMTGVALEGDPELPMKEAARDLHIPIIQNEKEISADPAMRDEGEILRTELEVIFDAEATVEQVNEFLKRYDAGIVSMLRGMALAVIRYPDPGSVDQLNELKDKIESEDIVLTAMKSAMAEREVFIAEEEEEDIRKIPEDITDMTRIDHHLAIRGHGAWNARSYLQDEGEHPWLVTGDAYGDGAPDDNFELDSEADDFGTDDSDSHGYHVLGIITGAFDPVSTATSGVDDVTGIFPDELKVRAVDIKTEEANTWPRRMNQLISRVNDIIDEEPDARIVMNTSLNSRTYDDQNDPALSWIYKVRGGFPAIMESGAGLENRFLHFTSTGNATTWSGATLPVDQHWDAKDNSMFAYAALGDTDVSILGFSAEPPRLTNTFVVENRVNTDQDTDEGQRPVPGCANENSIMNGNLSAIGTEVWSFTASWSGSASGTSMATPQAAGVAAWVWSMNPGLTVHEVRNLINQTAESRATNTLTPDSEDCNDILPQPVVDVYAAVLEAGGEEVRRSILDVNETGQFDDSDLQTYLDEFGERNGELDYSRYDLNGDGRTGSDGQDRFDLNMNGDYGQVSFDAKGYQLSYNESSLEDVDILCYYAYSDMYDGDATKRDDMLDEPCEFDVLRRMPLAINDYATVWKGAGVDIQVLTNDSNPDPREHFVIHEVSDVNNGSVQVTEDNTVIRYTADQDFTGIETFSYTIINESGLVSDPATVTLSIWDGLVLVQPQIEENILLRPDLIHRNDMRDIILSGLTEDRVHTAIYIARNGITHELETLGGPSVEAEALNNNGVVIGQSDIDEEVRNPYRWSAEDGMEVLPAPDMNSDDPELSNTTDFIASESFETLSDATGRAASMIPESELSDRLMKDADPLSGLRRELEMLQAVSAEDSGNDDAGMMLSGATTQETEVVVELSGEAKDINEDEMIVGSYGPYAMFWVDGEPVNLTGKYDIIGNAAAINNRGMIGGSYFDVNTEELHGYILDTGLNEADDGEESFISLGSLGGSFTAVMSLNDVGQAVGYSQVSYESDRLEAFLWTPEREMVALGTLGGNASMAFDINTHQQIVGTAYTEDGATRGFLWMDGEMYDVNEFVQEEAFTVTMVFDINDNGDMSVIGYTDEDAVEVRLLEAGLNR